MDLSNIQELLNSSFIGTGILVTMLGSIVYSIKELPKLLFKITSNKISNKFVYTARIFEYDDLFNLFEKWLSDNHQKEYRDVEARLFSGDASPNEDKQLRKSPLISYNQSVNVFTIMINGKRIFITKQKEKLEHSQSFRTLYGYHYSIRGFMGKEAITKLLQDIVNCHYEKFNENQVRIKVNDKYGNWDNFSTITVKDLSKIIIDPEKKTRIIEDLRLFSESKEWYASLSIPYKRMYCFEGQPGTGKTSISLAIAAHEKRDVYILNPMSLENDGAMQRAYSNLSPNAVLIIEDIDAVFTKREGTQNVSFSCLLNSTDGAFFKEGLITCITTNHIERLDPALLRAGRTDMILEIGYPQVAQIDEYLSLFYGKETTICFDCENVLLSMSAVQEICISNRTNVKGAINAIKDRLIVKPLFIKHS